MRGLRRTGSVKTWRKVPPKIVIDAPGVQVPDNAGEGLFSKCFILAVTNPQPMIFCVSLMPQFIDPEIAYVPQVTFMIAVYALMVFVCMIFLRAHRRPHARLPRKGQRPEAHEQGERRDLHAARLLGALEHGAAVPLRHPQRGVSKGARLWHNAHLNVQPGAFRVRAAPI